MKVAQSCLCVGFGCHISDCVMYLFITRLPKMYLAVYFRHGKLLQREPKIKKRCTPSNESTLYNELAKVPHIRTDHTDPIEHLMSLYAQFQIALLKDAGGKGIDDVESYHDVHPIIVIYR